MLRQQYNRGT